VRDWRGGGFASEFRWLGALAGVAEWLGMPGVVNAALHGAALRAQLDGLLAVWQPPLAD
jgi:hypothetical protein